MATSQNNNKNTSYNNNKIIETNQDKIKQILTESGLNPSDYIFNSSQEQTSNQSINSSKNSVEKQPQSSIISGKSVSYVQQHPPPPPIIKRQKSQTQLSNNMNQHITSPRRTPPPPPSSQIPFNHVSNKIYTNLSTENYLNEIDIINNPPVKVVKPNTQNVVYRKDIRIRYLQPPTPPPPAPIIIREKRLPPNPPESPLLIRERKPEPRTPPPLTIRERPPTPPPLLQPCFIDKSLPPPPQQPRQIIVERLPTPPPKPRTVIFEKWLPYKRVKRPILLQKAAPPPPIKPTRNVIIEYEPLKVYTVRRVIEEGVFRVDPKEYTYYNNHHSDGNVRIVDRIDDLPMPSEQLMRALKTYNRENLYASNGGISIDSDQLTNVTRLSNTPIQRQEETILQNHDLSKPTPTIVSHKRPQSKTSSHSS